MNNRRQILFSIGAVAAAASFGATRLNAAIAGSVHKQCALKLPDETLPEPSVAISLARLSTELQETSAKRHSEAKARRSWRRANLLYGMTEIQGFYVDDKAKDIVLVGAAERNKVPLQTQDLVVALRSALFRYPQIKDGKKSYIQPGVTIDPVDKLWKRMKGASGTASEAYCKSNNFSRVFGMPFNCRSASVLLEADARMKKVMWGVEPLLIDNPFPTIDVLRAKRVAALGHERASRTSTGMRYWFMPDLFSYQSDRRTGTVLYDRKVIALNSVGRKFEGDKHVDAKAFDPDSRFVTCAWTERMSDFFGAEEIWQDMANIFGHFALAKTLERNGALSKFGSRLPYLLNEMPVPYVKTATTFPSIKRMGAPICGGVSLNFSNRSLVDTGTQLNGDVAQKIRFARPSQRAIRWELS
ncbi:MAG: hypothetical protein AAGF81_00695 [Pseudomonadota bacterium]